MKDLAIQLNTTGSMQDTLKQAQSEDSRLEVYLQCGHNFNGKVLSVGDNYAVIGRLESREFFDAKIRLKDISAVSLQTREV